MAAAAPSINDQAGLGRRCCASLGAPLVEIHGQHDDRGLLNPRGHRALLDALRPDRRAARRTRPAHGCRRPRTRLAEAREPIEAAERDREWLAHAVAELNALAPEPGEEAGAGDSSAPAMQKGARLGRRTGHDRGGCCDGSDGGLAQLRAGRAAARPDRANMQAAGRSARRRWTGR